MINKKPIFIHSLFRSGSTYLLSVFNRSKAGYCCYQEPLHELAVFARDNPELLLQDHGKEKRLLLRHPYQEESYFHKLYEAWPAWKNTLQEPAVYGNYFASADTDIPVTYWHSLVEAAKDRPVFQECRTSGRIGFIKRQLGGYHIYLWRNPWDQWWSYKVSPYFDLANQLIINAPNSLSSVKVLRSALNLEHYPHKDIAGAFAYFSEKPLSAEKSYLVFYMLWCLAIKEGQEQGDILLNIDRLTDSPTYRDEIKKHLEDAGINDIDFSDCDVPQGWYLEEDKAFFVSLEDRVHGWLIEGGWHKRDLDQLQAVRQNFQPSNWNNEIEKLNINDLAEQAGRARAIAKKFETKLAVTMYESTAKSVQTEVALSQALMQLHAVYASKSWNITAPLRSMGGAVRGFLQYSKIVWLALKSKIKLLLDRVKEHPCLKKR